mgnify:FL=1
MNSTEEAIEAMDELINSDGAVSLPGLELDPVVEHFVDEKYGSQLSEIKDEEERKKMRDKWVKYYKEGEGKQTIQMEINNIKAMYGAAKDQIQFVTEAAASAVASNAVPAVITVGQATSTPNTGYALIENKTKKNQLLSMLKQIGAFLVSLLKSAVAIAFAVPAAVINLIKTLATTKKTVNAIPV